VGEERGQREHGAWVPGADPYHARPGEYRPRRARPEPPDPYLPRSDYPLRPGPYLPPPASSASDRHSAARPDPLRDPFPSPPPAPPARPARELGADWFRPRPDRADQFGPGRYPEQRRAREQPAAEWHTGKRYTEDDAAAPDRPGAAGAAQPEAERYPADFPTQVFMSSAQAAWQQPAPPAPSGNWPRPAAAGPGPRTEPGPRTGPGPAAGLRRGRWDQPPPSAGRRPPAVPAPGPFPSRPRYPAGGQHQAAPFPPAPDPAELYPPPPGPGRRAGNPPRRAQPARGRGARNGLLIGAACVAVLVLAALVFFVA